MVTQSAVISGKTKFTGTGVTANHAHLVKILNK